MTSNTISLNPSTIARVLGIVAFLLVLASIAGQLTARLTTHGSVFGLIRLFNIDDEQNVPTFFSTFLLLCAALLLGVITIQKRSQMDSHASYWAVLSFGFLFMAADETSSIHNLPSEPIRNLLGNVDLGIFHFAWVIPFSAILLVLAIFFRRFLLHVPLKTRLGFLFAATLYIGGAVGLELIGGRHIELHGDDLTYIMLAAVEESLEMTGVIIFNWALLVYIADNFKEIRIQVYAVRDEVNHLRENIKEDQQM